MIWNVIRNEHTKIFKRWMLWVELILMALLALGFQLAIFAILNSGTIPMDERLSFTQMITWPLAFANILSYSGGDTLGGVFITILVGSVTAQEYTWRTLQLWLSRGIPRSTLAIGKFIGFFLPAVLIVLSAMLAGGVITAFFSVKYDGSLYLDQLNFLHLCLSLLRTAFTLLPIAALTFLLAVASRSTAIAVSVGLAYVLLVENILVQVMGIFGEPFSKISEFLPGSLAKSLMSLNQLAGDVGGNTATGSLPPVLAGIGIAIWMLFFLGTGIIIFVRQDFSG